MNMNKNNRIKITNIIIGLISLLAVVSGVFLWKIKNKSKDLAVQNISNPSMLATQNVSKLDLYSENHKIQEDIINDFQTKILNYKSNKFGISFNYPSTVLDHEYDADRNFSFLKSSEIIINEDHNYIEIYSKFNPDFSYKIKLLSFSLEKGETVKDGIRKLFSVNNKNCEVIKIDLSSFKEVNDMDMNGAYDIINVKGLQDETECGNYGSGGFAKLLYDKDFPSKIIMLVHGNGGSFMDIKNKDFFVDFIKSIKLYK